MSPAQTPPSAQGTGRAKKTILTHTITVIVTALAFLGGVWLLLDKESDFQFGWQDGRPTLDVKSRDAFGKIIDSYLEREGRDAEALLRERGFFRPDAITPTALGEIVAQKLAEGPASAGFTVEALRQQDFYRLGDATLIHALSQLDPETTFSRQLRALLYQRVGPFESPTTLADADGDFLANVLADLGKEHPLTATMWSGFVAFRWDFLRPELKVRVVPVRSSQHMPLPGAGTTGERAFVCPGSELFGKLLHLWTDDGAVSLSVQARGRRLPQDCTNALNQLVDLFKGEVEIGLAENVFRSHFPDAENAAGVLVNILVYPDGFAPMPLDSPGG